VSVEIVVLDRSTWPALARMFEQGGDPSRCWCAFWRLGSAESAGMSTAENRSWLETEARSDSAVPVGLVAVADGEAVGWVSMAPRENFHRIARSRTIPVLPGEGVWSIVCFVVDRSARRTGLTSTLLDGAVAFAERHGAQTLEAYPVAVPEGKRVPAAAGYTGIESTFLKAGFERVAETTSSAGGLPRVVVRRDAS